MQIQKLFSRKEWLIIIYKLDLNFQLFETTTLFMTVLVGAFMLQVYPLWENCILYANLSPLLPKSRFTSFSIFVGWNIKLLQRTNAPVLLFDSWVSFYVHLDPESIRKLYNFLLPNWKNISQFNSLLPFTFLVSYLTKPFFLLNCCWKWFIFSPVSAAPTRPCTCSSRGQLWLLKDVAASLLKKYLTTWSI